MPKYEIRNKFYWKHFVETQSGNEIWLVFHWKIFIEKFYQKCGLETSFRLFCIYQQLSTDSIAKSNFWNELIILDNSKYQNYRNMSKPACRLHQILLHRESFKHKRGSGTSFKTLFFVELFDENFSFVNMR